MKWCRTLVIFDEGDLALSADWEAIHASYVRSIEAIDYPKGSGTLTLRRKKKRPDGQWNRNGVGYLRARFLEHIQKKEKWRAEVGLDLGKDSVPPTLRQYPGLRPYQEPITSEFGGFDFVTRAPNGTQVAIEWETGNISSSHRSMNKLAIALETEKIDAGVLIVPSRALYEHLTDRVGNIGELSGYLGMWESLKSGVRRGLLAVTVVEHDKLTDSRAFRYLATGMDGRARQGRAKRR